MSFPTDALIKLYSSRWDVELDLKHLKTSLGMDVLRSKTPEMIRKEIYAFLIVYNLLRGLMWNAGTNYSTPPLRLSLQGTRNHLINFLPEFISACHSLRYRIYLSLLTVIVHKVVPLRQGRVEPRVLKRRPKSYPFMTSTRKLLRRKLAAA